MQTACDGTPCPGQRPQWLVYPRLIPNTQRQVVWPDSGSVIIWITPRGWGESDSNNHTFLQVYGQDNAPEHGGYVLERVPGVLGLGLAGDVWRFGSAPTFPDRISVSSATSPWILGQPHQLALVWSPNRGLRLLVDGGVATQNVAKFDEMRFAGFPDRLASFLTVGDTSGTSINVTHIDRLEVYDHGLSDTFIQKLYQSCPTQNCNTNGDPHPMLGFTVHPETQTLSARLEMDDEAQKGDYVVFSLRKSGKQVGSSVSVGFQRSAATATLSTLALLPGDFALLAALHRVGAPSISLTTKIHKPATAAWLGKDFGVVGKSPPAPWSPLAVSRSNGGSVEVACFGRRYTFGAGGLVSQITSQGKALLKRPVHVEIVVNGTPLSWSYTSPLVLPGATRTIVRQRAFAPNGMRLEVSTILDYDGLAWFQLSLAHVPPLAQIDSIALAIPYDPAVAMYFHRGNPTGFPGPTTYTGGIPSATSASDDTDAAHDGGRMISSFAPFTWVGDNDRGLFWFAESARFWPNRYSEAMGTRPLEFSQEGGALVQRFNLMHGQWGAASAQEATMWRLGLGLQATPIRPASNARQVGLQQETLGATQANILWPFADNSSGWLPTAFGFLRPACPSSLTSTIVSEHQNKQKAVPYALLTELARPADQHTQLAGLWTWFQGQWLMQAGQAEPGAWAFDSPYDHGSCPHAPPEQNVFLHAVDPETKAWGDLTAYYAKILAKSFHVDGFYHDQTLLYPREYARDVDRPDARDASGIRYPIYAIRDYRELYRRTYVERQQHAPLGFSIAHGSGVLNAPIIAYDVGFLNGEQLRPSLDAAVQSCMDWSYFKPSDPSHPSDPSPLTSFGGERLDIFRATFMGRQWGVTPYFLAFAFSETKCPAVPQCPSQQANDACNAGGPARTREAIALALLHDVGLWTVWLDPNVVQEAFTNGIGHFQKNWGFDWPGARLVAYFDPNPAVMLSGTSDVLASTYIGGTTQHTRSMIVLGNLSVSQDSQVNVTLKGTYFHLGVVTVRDVHDNLISPISGSNDTYHVTVSARGYLLLLVQE